MTLDLSRYARGNPVMQGEYETDIWVNGEWQARQAVRFVVLNNDGESDAAPCIATKQLVGFGIAIEANGTNGDTCVPVGDRVSQATTHFDVGEQRLDIEVPQAMLARGLRAMVPPSQWDHGVTAAQLAWRMNIHRTATGDRRVVSRFLAADTGFNTGAWRLRHGGTWSASSYQRHHLYVERPVAASRAQWRVGEFLLADEGFGAQNLRGLSIVTDPRMSDDGTAGDAPVIRGLARTHALVRITQGGVVLRELSVPPGPFIVDDLQGAGQGGDIDVAIEEEDGQRTTHRVSSFAMPERLREGHARYAAAVGRTVGMHREHALVEAGWRRGIANRVTLRAGGRAARDSMSLLTGIAVDTLAGAFAADALQGRSRGEANRRGWRLRYGRRWRAGSTITMGLSRRRETRIGSFGRRRSPVGRASSGSTRVDAMLQHGLGDDRGALSLRTSFVARGGRRSADVDHAVVWNRSWRQASLDLSWQLSRRRAGEDGRARRDMTTQLGLSMPFGVSSAPTLTASVRALPVGQVSHQAAITGRLGDEGGVGYGASVGRSDRGDSRIGVAVTRLFEGGEGSLAADHAGGASSQSVSTSGAIVGHGGGITLAQRLGEAMALVRAPGAGGARIASHAGTHLNGRGFAVVPFLAPYRWNAIDVDPAGLSLDVAMASTRRRIVPTAGALVAVTFETDIGRTVLFSARRVDGSPIPFAADVRDGEGRSVGVVGQAGHIFVRDAEPQGSLTVHWGGEGAGSCLLRRTGQPTASAGLTRQQGVCE